MTIRERFEKLQRYDCQPPANDDFGPVDDGDYVDRSDVLALADELDREMAHAMMGTQSDKPRQPTKGPTE